MDWRLTVLSLGAFAGSMESFVLPGLLPLIGADLGISMSQTGYIVFAYSLAYAAAGPVLASLFGPADRRRTLAGAEFVFGCSALFAAGMPTLALIIAGRLLLAGAAALFTSLAQATAIALATTGFRGRAVSIVVTGSTVAIAVGAPLGTLLAAQFGWRVVYGFVGALALLASAIMWLRLPSGIAAPRLSLRERLGVARLDGMPAALLMTLLYMTGSSMATIYVAAISREVAGMPPAMLPVVLLANGLGAVSGGIVGGRLVDRLGPFPTFVINAVSAIVVLIGVSALQLWPGVLLAPLWMALAFLLGLLAWSLFASQVSLCASLAPNAVPLAASLNMSAVSAGAAMAALLGGAVIDQINAGALGLVGAVPVLLALGIGVASRRVLLGAR